MFFEGKVYGETKYLAKIDKSGALHVVEVEAEFETHTMAPKDGMELVRIPPAKAKPIIADLEYAEDVAISEDDLNRLRHFILDRAMFRAQA